MARDLLCRLLHFVILLISSKLIYLSNASLSFFPELESLSVINVKDSNQNNVYYKEVEFEMRGRNFFSGMEIKITHEPAERNSICENFKDYNITELWTKENVSHFVMLLPKSAQENVFFCVRYYRSDSDSTFHWYHQGLDVSFNGQRNQDPRIL